MVEVEAVGLSHRKKYKVKEQRERKEERHILSGLFC